MSVKPQKFKSELEARIRLLQPSGHYYDIAVSCGYSHEYVRRWFKSNLINDKIYEKAKEHLAQLVAEDSARLEEVKSIATK